jgi:hypothetical protein
VKSDFGSIRVLIQNKQKKDLTGERGGNGEGKIGRDVYRWPDVEVRDVRINR